MDPFSDLLKPTQSSSSSRPSGTNSSSSSRPGTPGSGNDSFANLTAKFGTAGKKKQMSQMSLAERQKLQAEADKQNAQKSKDSWSGLDLLGGPMQPPSSTTSEPSSQSSQPSQDIDELFDVFNKPPPPPVKPKSPSPPPPAREESPVPQESNNPPGDDPRDGPIAELVDMGFSAEQAREALANTDTGLDVGQAISFLMNQAHKATRPKHEQEEMDPEQHRRRQQQLKNPLAAYKDTEIGKLATDFSATFMSKAGQFWQQGRKNVAKAIETYQHQSAPNDGTPAWMREAEKYKGQSVDVTTESPEANALDMPQQPPSGLSARQARHQKVMEESSQRTRSETRPAAKKDVAPQRQTQTPDPFVSRAQRFKNSKPDEEVMYSPRNRNKPATPPPQQQTQKQPVQQKEARQQPVISPTAMDMISQARKSGMESYQRGDYAHAVQSFTQALQSAPPKHLISTVLLSNRAKCHLLAGDAKLACDDADKGVLIVGSSMGQGETVEGKNLKDIWAKLVTKKAESSEQLEKYQQALDCWNLLMHNGYSNKQALEGRRRCQAALAPPPKPQAAAASKRAPASNGPTSKEGQAAVSRVKNQYQAQEKMNSERQVLLESIEAKIANWRQGKEDNMRALLASLDTVLWDELQWKSVSMADLVMPKKVKIAYMKAVAKTHPDKIDDSETTEHKMVANAVFITLNSAWDGFKQQNGLSG